MKTEIYIATHKAYDFPNHDGYIPIHVGKALTEVDLGIIGDDTGDNISVLNKSFCELTALYWIWKNSKADVLGLVHYRRHFKSIDDKLNMSFNTEKILNPDLGFNNQQNFLYVLTPEKIFYRKYKIQFGVTLRKQYELNHYKKDWEITRKILLEKYPNYKEALINTELQKEASFCNMMIADRKTFHTYCEWLFDILFECQKQIDVSEYCDYQKRLFGFLSERLLNVFLKNNLNTNYLSISSV